MKLITLGALVFGGTLVVAAPMVVFTPLEPDADIPTFAASVARANEVHADEAPGAAARDQIRRAVIQRAQALRAAPCDAKARAAYLAAVADYSVAKMAAVRAGTDDQWRTALDDQFGQVVDQQVADGFVTMKESGKALMAGASRGLSAGLARGHEADAPEMNDTTACERQQAGEAVPPLELVHPHDRPRPGPVSTEPERKANLVRVAREAAHDALDHQACTASGRERLISGLSYYYEMRHSRRSFWPKNAGPDRAIDERVASLIRRGMLQPRDLPHWVARAAPHVAATPVAAGPCRISG